MSAVEAAGAIGLALYAGHHVGDYWVQTDHQAGHKGQAGAGGVRTCTAHVLSYLATQFGCLLLLWLTTGVRISVLGLLAGLAMSGITHYLADRREFGIMLRLARLLPGKDNFLKLGGPRPHQLYAIRPGGTEKVALDNPSLGTGAWALDQSWHIFFGVFIPALIMAAMH